MIILWIKFFIIKYILIVAFKPYNCDHWEYKLAHDILEGYDPSIRPSIRHNSTINVTFGLALTQLIDVVSFKILRKLFLFLRFIDKEIYYINAKLMHIKDSNKNRILKEKLYN